MKQFKVFYSWQSDLPGNTNRNFLNTCIDEAVKNCNSVVDGMEIEADRDTKGKTGSPNISQTIFEKIDECDLFIADVSIVNSNMIAADGVTDDGKKDIDGSVSDRTENSKNQEFRYTPNPNVLIELGYAVKHLGWERVICFMNTDYGNQKKLPFDLDHQRVTGYSLSVPNKDKSKVKKELRGIISDTILELSKTNGPQKKGKSYHVVGTYDPISKKIDADLVAYDVKNYRWVEDFFDKRKKKAETLIEEIKSFDIPLKEEAIKEIVNTPVHQVALSQSDSLKNLQRLIGINNDDDNYMEYAFPARDEDDIKELCRTYLSISLDILDKSFFNLGGMKIQRIGFPKTPWGGGELNKKGTDEEKEKDEKLEELHCCLIEIQELDLYLKTFDDVLLFPLAIENNSTETDTDIGVAVDVETNCDVVVPSVDFIHPDLKEAAQYIYQEGFPRDLLFLENDSEIKYDDDRYLYYNPDEPFYGTAVPGLPNQIDEKEYGYAMECYIATPENKSRYAFSISGLRANEKKWLGGIIALRKPTEKMECVFVKMHYRIISSNTSGDLNGEIVFNDRMR